MQATQDMELARPKTGEHGEFGDFQEVHSITGSRGIYGGLESVYAKRPTVYDLEQMLLRDSQATALEKVQVQTILATIARIEEGGEGDKGEAQWARDNFLRPAHEGGMRTPLRLVLAQMCGAFARRQAFFEIAWEDDDNGDLVIDKLAFRRASTCTIKTDDKQNFAGFNQEGYRKNGERFFRTFDANKAFVYVHGHSATNPLEGESVFEAAYHNHVNKMKLLLLFFMYLQKYGIPPLNAHVESPLKSDQEKMLEKAEAIRAGSTVVTGPGETFGTITSAQTVGGSQGGTADFREAIRYLDSQMATGMLAGFLQLPVTNQTGSYALSRDSSDLFLLSLEAKQTELETAFTSGPMAKLVYHKFGPDAVYPRLKLTALSQEHEAKALDLLKAVLTTGNAPPMPVWLFDLLRDKAFANFDIHQDQIDEALAAYEEALKEGEDTNGVSQNGSAASAIASIVAKPAQDPAAALAPPGGPQTNGQGAPVGPAANVAAGNGNGTNGSGRVELIYNPQKQGRDESGRFGARTPYSNPPAKTGGATGSARPSTRGAGSSSSPPGGTRKFPGNVRKAPGATETPEGEEAEGDRPGVVALPDGSEVELSSSPVPGEHYIAVGLKSATPHAVFFGGSAGMRPLEVADVQLVVDQLAQSFDGGVNLIGRFVGDTANLALLAEPPPGEMETMIGLVKGTYGDTIGRVILDGKEVV